MKQNNIDQKITDPKEKQRFAQLLTSTGTRWQKNGMDRYYLGAIMLRELADFDLEYYKTGAISSAKLAGEQMSNNGARKLQGQMDEMKFYLDMKTREIKWNTNCENQELAEKMAANANRYF